MTEFQRHPGLACVLGNACNHRDKPIPWHFRCNQCRGPIHGAYLHDPCSVLVGQFENGSPIMECIDRKGCHERKQAVRETVPAQPADALLNIMPAPLEEATQTPPPQEAGPDQGGDDGTPTMMMVVVESPGEQSPIGTETPKVRRKRGPKAGSKRHERMKTEWYDLCKRYHETSVEGRAKPLPMSEFLKSDLSGPNIDDAKSNRVIFSRHYKLFKEGKLKSTSIKRDRPSLYPEVEEQVVSYVKLRMKLCSQHGTSSMTWQYLCDKAIQYSKLHAKKKYDNFKASQGWLMGVLKRGNLSNLSVQGEKSLEAARKEDGSRIASGFLEKLHHPMLVHKIPPCRVYHVDQTFLLYKSLPSKMYFDVDPRKTQDRMKEMLKSQDYIALVICVAGDGAKLPIAVVGREENPACFGLAPNSKPPLPYKSQPIAWCDDEAASWWIKNVFWPYHKRVHGDVPCILIDNDGRLNLGSSNSEGQHPKNLHLLHMPRNIASRYQPCSMGIIKTLKMNYHAALLESLVVALESEYSNTSSNYQSAQFGLCKGIQHGWSPHLLDAMEMLEQVWINKEIYFSTESIEKCFLGTGILPLPYAADTDNNNNNAANDHHCVRMNDADFEAMCGWMKQLSLFLAQNPNLRIPPALKGSFACENMVLGADTLIRLVTKWITVEDDELMLDTIIDGEVNQSIEEPLPEDPITTTTTNVPPVLPQQNGLFQISSAAECVEAVNAIHRYGQSIGVSFAAMLHGEAYLREIRKKNTQNVRQHHQPRNGAGPLPNAHHQ